MTARNIGVLDELERGYRQDDNSHSVAKVSSRFLLWTLLCGVIFTPFLLVVGVFIAIFGQLLLILAFWLGYKLCRAKRSWRPAVAFSLGAALSITVIIALSLISTELVNKLLYPAMLLGVAFTLGFITLLGGVIFAEHYRETCG